MSNESRALATRSAAEVASIARNARERWAALARRTDDEIAEHVLRAWSEPPLLAALREQYLDARTAGATDEYRTGFAQAVTTVARTAGQPHPWWLR